jgi:1-acyl-sn-glycerol-3-phosphate acyltransferase
VGLLRALARLLRVVLHLVQGVAIARWRFPRLDAAQREREVTRWAGQLVAHLGIRLEVSGDVAAAGPVLIVANHISWLDIVSLHAARFCRFVSKSDVHHWPLIGRLAEAAGTLFIERESRRDALRVVHQMAQALRQGQVLAVFPEGTTSDGLALLPFHANLLQAAIASDTPVQPVALQFLQEPGRQPSLLPCYVGDDTLAASVWRTVRARGLVVRLVFGPPQAAAGRERRPWAEALRDEVARLREMPVRPD